MLSSVISCASSPTLEELAETYRLSSLVSQKCRNGFSRRSQAIRSIGLSSRRVAQETVGDADSVSTLHVLQSVAAMFRLVDHSALLAYEVAALLSATDCVDKVEIKTGVTNVGRETPSSAINSSIRIPIVGQNGTACYVIASVKGSSDSALSVAAIQSLTRAAISLGDSRARAQQEPPVWKDTYGEEVAGLIVAATNMAELLNITRRVATSNVTVLFTGETGTGKELLARALHDASPRRDKPFIPFNCTAVPRDMLDSQLFGYRRGAFTGAQEAFQGVIRAASGGTLFLDEIGEMPIDLQPKLLRFLESGEVHPLGESRPTTVDVRIVGATNANLEKLLAEGKFREDLYYRLNVVRLPVPPLRERREEIPLLAQHYIDKFSREFHKSGLRLAEETMEYLVLFKWPGNVRQLTNEIRRMVALAESGAVLMPEHLSHEVAASRRTIPASQRELAPTEIVVRLDQPMPAAMQHVERTMIQYAMKLTSGHLEDAAQMLGLSRKGLYLKRIRLKMDDPEPGEHANTAAMPPATQQIGSPPGAPPVPGSLTADSPRER